MILVMFTRLAKAARQLAMVLSDMAMWRPALGLLTKRPSEHTHAVMDTSESQIQRLVL